MFQFDFRCLLSCLTHKILQIYKSNYSHVESYLIYLDAIISIQFIFFFCFWWINQNENGWRNMLDGVQNWNMTLRMWQSEYYVNVTKHKF